MTAPLHSESTRVRLRQGEKAATAGLLANTALSGIKIGAGILGNSYALVADGIESLLDIFSSLVVIGGLRVAATPPDSDHPYGHGKAEPVAAAVVSLGLLGSAAGLAALSLREILTPHHAPAAFTLWVLVGVIVVKETLFRVLANRAEHLGSHAVKADAWHHRSDAITSVAAFVGIGIALLGGPGYETADDFAALFACAIIAFNGVRLLRPAFAEIMDAAPVGGLDREIRAIAMRVEGVLGIEKCRLRKMGLDFYVDLHVLVHGESTVSEGHRIAHDVKDAIRLAHPAVADVLVHVEPQFP